MSRFLLLALLAGCAAPTTPATPAVEEAAGVAGTTAAPSPASTRAIRMAPRADRTRRATVDPPTRSGPHLNSTAYCETGLMANGHRTHVGAVAGNRWELGTVLRVSDSPYGAGTFRVEDRIGHGSSLDFAMPGDCDGARAWGRRDIRVEVAW